MATTLGKDGLIKVGTNTVAEILSFELTEETSLVDDSQLSDDDATYLADMGSWSVSGEAHYDPSDTGGQAALTSGASVTLHLHPIGATTGDPDINGSAIVKSLKVNNQKGQTVRFSFEATGNGALTHGTV